MADTIIGKIRAVITGDASGLVVATNKAEKSLKDLGQQAKKTSRETSTAMNGMAGTIATAFATTKLVQFVKESVTGASDLGEAMNVTREIFGSASDQIINFSKTAARSLGQSQKVALDGANTFATFGKSAGLAGTDLANFAIQFSGLASDLASFRNTTPEDAIQAIGAALRGETEPIRRFGVMLNDMSLRQEALRMGLVKTTKEALTPQNKVLAAGALIMAQTSDAQGDFARTSDGLANSSRILTANVEDLKAGLGQALLPTVQAIVGVINPLVMGFNSLSESSKKLLSMVGLLTAGLVLAKRGLASFGYELKDADGKANLLGKTMGFVGKGLGAIALAEGAIAMLNKLGDSGGKVERALQGVVIASEQTGGSLTAAFAELAKAEGDVGSFSNIWADFGKEFAIGGEGTKRNIEEIDRAFKKVLELSPSLAQQLIDDWTAQTLGLDQNSQAYRDNINELEKYQGWVDLAAGATDVLNDAVGATETPVQTATDAFAGAVDQLEDYRRLVLGVATVTKRDLTVATNDTIIATQDFLETMSEGTLSNQEFENALIEQADSLIALQFATKGQTGALKEVTPAMRFVIESMYRAAEAQGRTRAEANKLIKELGLLEGIDPQIAIMLTMDVSQVKAQIEQLKKGIEVAKRIGNFQMLAGLTKELEALVALGDAIQQIGDFTPSIGGGGGGGGKAEDPYAWVKDWVKNLADFSAKIVDRDFADRLIEMSADDIGKALADLIDEATQVGVSLLDGGTFVTLVGKVSEQLQAAANQLGGPGGLEERFAEATRNVEKFRDALADLEERFADFRRAEMGIGSYSTLERLDQELAKLEDLKARVQEAENAYRDFRGASVSALDEQLARLDDLRSNLDALRKGYNTLNESIAGDAALSPLERERKQLDSLRSALESVTRARQSYAESIEQQVGSIQYADRGGALFTAQKWLAKASAFRDILSGLRDRAFPAAIIRDVLNAGIDGGTKLGRKLLALSDTDLAELKRVQQQISSVAAQTGEIAASVLFDADVSAADSAFKDQLALVQQLYQQAIAQAETQFQSQQAIVDGMFQQQLADARAALDQQKIIVEALFQTAISEAKQHLAEAEAVAKTLETAINDLKDTMRELIQSIADAVAKATQQPGQAGYTDQAMRPGQVPEGLIPTNLVGGSPATAGSGGYTGLGFDPTTGAGYVRSPQGRTFILPPGIDFGALSRAVQPRAEGGSVINGNPYMVGERGPELFVPQRSGGIVSAEDLAMIGATRGPATYNITVNARGDATEVGRQVIKAIQEFERRNGTGWRS